MYLFPRLDTAQATLLAEEYAGCDISTLNEISSEEGLRFDIVNFTAVGAQRVSEAALLKLRERIVDLAEKNGYPSRRTRRDQQHFDFTAVRLLLESMDIVPAEAARDEVWQYLTCVLVPDVVFWRFADPKSGRIDSRRILGGNRNALGRLWWRGYLLQDLGAEDGLWLLDPERALNEDNLVALLERTSTAGLGRLSVTIAKEYLRRRPDVLRLGSSPAQRLMREGMKRLVRFASFIEFEALTSEESSQLVGEIFEHTVDSLRHEQAEAAGP